MQVRTPPASPGRLSNQKAIFYKTSRCFWQKFPEPMELSFEPTWSGPPLPAASSTGLDPSFQELKVWVLV